MADDITRYAREGYAAYGQSTGGKNYVGLPMPTWEELPVKIQEAWRVATAAILGASKRPQTQADRAADQKAERAVAEARAAKAALPNGLVEI